MTIISNYLFGWDYLEPIIIGSIALEENILFLGKHGTGKSSLARFLASAISDENNKMKLMKYAMDKENLLSMVGCPNPEKLRVGKLDYATHERSIFNADIVLMDEITRASKENQNMVLEMLEERTVFGKPLKYRFVVATANDETYKGAMKLDAALLDRFVAVIPVPDLMGVKSVLTAEEIFEMINLNLFKRDITLKDSNKSLNDLIKNTQENIKKLWKSSAKDSIQSFASKFFAILKSSMQSILAKSPGVSLMSPRQVTKHFCPLAIAVSAYYKSIDSSNKDFLKDGTWQAIEYSLCTKLGIPIDEVKKIFLSLSEILVNEEDVITNIKIGLFNGDIPSRIKTYIDNCKIINKSLEYSDIVGFVGDILNTFNSKEKMQEVENIALLNFYKNYEPAFKGDYNKYNIFSI